MKRYFVLALGTAFVLSAVQESQAGLFDLFRSKRRGNGCCQPDPCCQPKKKCGFLGFLHHNKGGDCCEPVSCCAPTPTCCAPAPTCCTPAGGGTPSLAPKKPYEETPPTPKKDSAPPKPGKKPKA